MKIKPEHANEVTALISEFISAHSQEVAKRAQSVSPERLRWDVFFVAVPEHLVSEIYKYAHDDHIDTLLRRIFKA